MQVSTSPVLADVWEPAYLSGQDPEAAVLDAIAELGPEPEAEI
jgi:hypothetical protein